MWSFELWRLKRRKRKSERSYSKYVAEAKGEERDQRIAEAMAVRGEQDDEILALRTRILSDEAETVGIPLPPLSDKESWVEGLMPGTVRLSLAAQSALLRAIRKEKRERWSFAAFILKEIITPLIGVLGAIMGLISLIHALHH